MDLELPYSRAMQEEYEELLRMKYPPSVVIDNNASDRATVIEFDSQTRHGILLDLLQILSDLNLIITKAYVSSDGKWIMDVFNVTDQSGCKVQDENVLECIRTSLGPDSGLALLRRPEVKASSHDTVMELIGNDRPGLLSEVSSVLKDLKCNIVSADVWTHNTRAAAVIHITDEESGSAVDDTERLGRIKELLCDVMKGSNGGREAKAIVSHDVTRTDRRLHQMMYADRDYELKEEECSVEGKKRITVDVVNWYNKGYSMVMIRCKDRPKLLLDTVCALMDMDYVVFHAYINAERAEAYQEHFIRHKYGSLVESDAEKDRVFRCLEAAIERRVSEGLKLELCIADKVGLLSYVTRIFCENGLTVSRAEVTTKAGMAVNTLYVREASGISIDANVIECIRTAIGQTFIHVKEVPEETKRPAADSVLRFHFWSLFKPRSFFGDAVEVFATRRKSIYLVSLGAILVALIKYRYYRSSSYGFFSRH